MIAERTAPANSQMRSVINITSATLYTDSGDSTSIALSQVLVHASGPSRIGMGVHERALAMGDTLLVYGLPPTSLDVTEGEVHVEMVVDGTLRLAGHVTGGRALRLSATCRHIIFFKGGHGVRCG